MAARNSTGDADSRIEGRRDSPERPALASRVVEYEARPNRRTVYPPGLSGVELMATWLTADDDAFVDLEAVR